MSSPNALMLNPSSGTIVLPVGGTGGFVAKLKLSNGAEIDAQNDVVIFAVSKQKDIFAKSHHAEVIWKELPIVSEDNGFSVRVNITNSDTRNLSPGKYVWDLTLVTDPERDENNKVIVQDDSDTVVPIFARSGRLPEFRLCEVTTIV